MYPPQHHAFTRVYMLRRPVRQLVGDANRLFSLEIVEHRGRVASPACRVWTVSGNSVLMWNYLCVCPSLPLSSAGARRILWKILAAARGTCVGFCRCTVACAAAAETWVIGRPLCPYLLFFLLEFRQNTYTCFIEYVIGANTERKATAPIVNNNSTFFHPPCPPDLCTLRCFVSLLFSCLR